jgi:N-acetylglucosaminyldiphosphoundecaprenol N-acetyl-beta-D-mannosaminyltransferase
MAIRKESFFDIPVSIFTIDELGSFIKESVNSKSKNTLYGFSLHSIYNINKLPEIVSLGKQADLIVTDGRPFYWLLKLFRIPVRCNISIPESVMLTLRIADQEKYKVLLFGSEETLNRDAGLKINKQYPGIILLEGIPGYFDFDKDIEAILDRINLLNPDILLIGISSPIKERLAFKFKERLNARFIIPCGGVIDILAGKTKLTPRIIKSIGLASLYRVIQEPKRLLLDRLKFYRFIFLNFLPVLFWNALFKKGRGFSIIDHYSKK